jgi:hypothetical protein
LKRAVRAMCRDGGGYGIHCASTEQGPCPAPTWAMASRIGACGLQNVHECRSQQTVGTNANPSCADRSTAMRDTRRVAAIGKKQIDTIVVSKRAHEHLRRLARTLTPHFLFVCSFISRLTQQRAWHSCCSIAGA